ncbi:hypothetical protein [Acetobacter oeni]|uniref:Uncharacterized protein n=1 Tax=Acetobacter oeni TaxID=304077 RepID=A0A511XKD7_9PROT|nr:hypothetical protein [Acetobacter oeni]GEN63415.1 hypothetical protein AOE01nite_16390 [Acetobacter oeni]
MTKKGSLIKNKYTGAYDGVTVQCIFFILNNGEVIVFILVSINGGVGVVPI